MSKKAPPDKITLSFDLHDLPTAQHRAGLAGLILQIDSMKKRKLDARLIPDLDEPTATTVDVMFTPESLQGILDDLYDAKIVEVVVANKWPGESKPKPGEYFVQKKDPKTGEMKQAPGFAYDVVQPQAPCLSTYLNPQRDNPWLKLWQTMVWAIPRGINTTRAPYNRRAAKEHCAEGRATWDQLLADQELRASGRFKTEPISGALMLGAQAVNAEAIPFAGRVDQNFLLHFWQVVVMTFVPQVVKKDAKVESHGYVLAIPDVADLREFRENFPEIIDRLPPERRGMFPTGALIDLPAQANLEVLRQLKEAKDQESSAKHAVSRDQGTTTDSTRVRQALVAGKALGQWETSVRAVESFHMLKLGNNIKMLSFARVADRPGLIRNYVQITENYRNPLFRASLLRALVDEEPWYGRMLELFAEYPWPFFLEGEKTPKYIPRFGRDAKDQFRAFSGDLKNMKPDDMTDDESLKHLALVIQRLINKYVEGRAEVKTGKKVKDFHKVKDDKGRERRIYPNEFREAQQRVCNDAFLAMRSRHDQDFVEFFAGSICSVAQFLSADEYAYLTRVLLTKPNPSPVAPRGITWEDVKALAMIAVSACAFTVRPRETQTQGSNA